MKAMSQYKQILDSAVSRDSAEKKKLSELKEHQQKLQNTARVTLKNANAASALLKKKRALASQSPENRRFLPKLSDSAEMERASSRVQEVKAALQITAEKRRQRSDEKQNNNVSSAWVQSFPGISKSLKKSLWHRLHRRKQQIILRPSEESMINGLRLRVAESLTDKSFSNADLVNEQLRAEQTFLLAMHPLVEEELATVAPTKSSDPWAEPGWHLVLNVPNNNISANNILPCAPSFPVLEKNLSEMASSSGRQAASLLQTSHLKCLVSPLSSFAVSSSPAETIATQSQKRKCCES